MSVQVSKTELKAKALEYFRQIETTGQAVVVTDHGQPTIEIRRYQQAQKHPLDLLRGSVLSFNQPFEPADNDDWEATK